MEHCSPPAPPQPPMGMCLGSHAACALRAPQPPPTACAWDRIEDVHYFPHTPGHMCMGSHRACALTPNPLGHLHEPPGACALAPPPSLLHVHGSQLLPGVCSKQVKASVCPKAFSTRLYVMVLIMPTVGPNIAFLSFKHCATSYRCAIKATRSVSFL